MAVVFGRPQGLGRQPLAGRFRTSGDIRRAGRGVEVHRPTTAPSSHARALRAPDRRKASPVPSRPIESARPRDGPWGRSSGLHRHSWAGCDGPLGSRRGCSSDLAGRLQRPDSHGEPGLATASGPPRAFQSFRTAVQEELLAEEYRCFSSLWRRQNGVTSLLRCERAMSSSAHPQLRWAVYRAETPAPDAQTALAVVRRALGPLWFRTAPCGAALPSGLLGGLRRAEPGRRRLR